MCLAEVLAKEHAAIEGRIVLAGDMHSLFHPQPSSDLLKASESSRVLGRIFAVVREVAGEEDQIRLPFECVDRVDRTLERFGAERIRRSLESDMCVAELDGHEGIGRFA